MTGSFIGRRILITGAGAGIGAATARAAAELGARIAILDRDGAAAESTAGALGRERALAVTGDVTDADLIEMGELMYASHESYSACGLGSDGTDLLVKLVRDRGPASGLFGAKITGGGSGGTVAIFGRAEAAPVIQEIAHAYTERCGRPTYLFRGSSPGACETDVAEVVT